ncbi:MAG: CBS domain-containing protein [Methanomicrobiales archaeon]|nr:CBS domain-containing protein [Methanomicrobiales archaeon]
MIASDIMTSPVYVVGPSENIAHARNLMLKHKISRLPVVQESGLIGIITKKDIGYRLRHTEPVWRRRPIDLVPVELLMTPSPCSVKSGEPVKAIAHLMVTNDFSGIPVIEGHKIVGIVTKSDLFRSAYLGSLPLEVGDLMEDAITVSRYHSLDHIVNLMIERDDKLVVVNNDGTLAGIITESNLAFYKCTDDKSGDMPEKGITRLRKEESAGRKYYRDVISVSAVAEDVMTGPVVTISPEDRVSEAVLVMREKHVSSLVVVEADEIKGILKRDDIIKEVAK